MVISFVGKIICCVDTCINVGGGSWFLMYMIRAHLKIQRLGEL